MAPETQQTEERAEDVAASEQEPEGGASGYRLAGLLGGLAAFAVLLTLPAPEGLSAAGWRAAAAGVLMAIWWMTEALPIYATALVPLAAFPVLGIADIRAAGAPYANPLIFLFLGGFLIAMAMQRWNLHRRLALSIIKRVGTRPKRIVAGFMLAAAFLSMWVSNTATAMMMLPIGLSVIELAQTGDDTRTASAPFAVALMLAIAYACSLGGLGTLIGTPTNALLAGFMIENYDMEISFARWMTLGVPLMVVGLALVYVVLTRFVFAFRMETLPGGRAFIEEELRAMGAMTRPEKMVAVVFGGVAMLWMTRPLLQDVVPGLSDAGIAIFGALVLFALPTGRGDGTFVLNWDWARRLPWGILLLFGGGLSLAAAVDDTGLAAWIGEGLSAVAGWPLVLIIALVVAVVVLLTELTSNTATAAAFLPVMAALAVGIGQSPLLLLVPATVAASCAFMLPVATPPNAIVYGSGALTIPQMVRAGVWLNLLFVVVVTAAAYLLLPLLFGIELGAVPDWASGN